ncbi:hypothetical protein KPH14_009147 [Odynerus spinipes]|uniref:Uncharacterized protein n=1 Tax=Odynerus spinipes TaxID=1348599 RepID=A0AAD9RNX8_9HYME|nr:hypothetical protein KPH14_009147 [Odynerus spinipes]
MAMETATTVTVDPAVFQETEVDFQEREHISLMNDEVPEPVQRKLELLRRERDLLERERAEADANGKATTFEFAGNRC